MGSGSPTTVADKVQEWFEARGADGFNVVPPLPPLEPGVFITFAEKVVPELQRRGIFRTEYEGRTLRENLGLPWPAIGAWNEHRSHANSSSSVSP